ncbi:hypothetical protein PJO48_29920, partial [Mycobacterium kansasii]
MDLGHAAVSADTPSTTTAQKTVNGNLSEASKSLVFSSLLPKMFLCLFYLCHMYGLLLKDYKFTA